MGKIFIRRIRNIELLEFILPTQGVHIVTGKNGSGKSTLFTCISRICNSNAFTSFKSSQNIDEFTGSICYSIDGEAVIYTRRNSGRWQPDSRGLGIFERYGYPEIIHIGTRRERTFIQDDTQGRRQRNVESWLIESLNDVFCTNKFSNMTKYTVGDCRGRGNALERRRNTAFIIHNANGSKYSERNFSFGEILLLNLLFYIRNVRNGSLVLIDEIELALHPSAQVKLIKILHDVAISKRLTILISTHSSSIIRSQKHVILLNMDRGQVEVIYKCPPAKAIGAIGMREDTMPDIIILVEDDMARGFMEALIQKYKSIIGEKNYLDIRVMCVGGFANTIEFYIEANGYIFYNNVYVVAFLDKDVKTDIIDYPHFGNTRIIQQFYEHRLRMRFLPFTPEVLLYRIFRDKKVDFLSKFRDEYHNQRIDYNIDNAIDFHEYEQPGGTFETQTSYNEWLDMKGTVRNSCKAVSTAIASSLSNETNAQIQEIYRFCFKFAVDEYEGTEINVRELLGPVMNRS